MAWGIAAFMQWAVTAFLLISLSLAMVAVCVLVLVGLWRAGKVAQ